MWVHATARASGAVGYPGMSGVTVAIWMTRKGEVGGGLAIAIAIRLPWS